MKTVRLLKTEDDSYRTEDGAFIVTGFSGDFKICIIKGETDVGDHYSTLVSDLSSLRCARVWIKNFYRTMTIEKELVPLTELEAIAIKNLDTFMPKTGTFAFNTEHDCSALGLVHHEGTIHYLYQTVAEFYLSNTYNY